MKDPRLIARVKDSLSTLLVVSFRPDAEALDALADNETEDEAEYHRLRAAAAETREQDPSNEGQEALKVEAPSADNGSMEQSNSQGGQMPKLSFTLVGDEDESNIIVFVPGENKMRVAHSTHPYFDKIVEGAIAGDESIADLFDLAETAATKFQRLSERVTVGNGQIHLDGEPIDNVLTEQVLRFIDAGVDDWRPLVAFFENVQANQSEHSREQLYAWLAREDFTITEDGLIVGYKGVAKTDEGYCSINSGRAIVNGEVHRGRIPNPLGATVEMPRSAVAFDPGVGCSTGLHVGSFEYANGFAQGALLEVLVNPRDVVSVPTDCDAQKMRVCRYVVRGLIDAPHTVPVTDAWDTDAWDTDEDAWGDGEYDFEEGW